MLSLPSLVLMLEMLLMLMLEEKERMSSPQAVGLDLHPGLEDFSSPIEQRRQSHVKTLLLRGRGEGL